MLFCSSESVPMTVGPNEFLKLTWISNGFSNTFCHRHLIALIHGKVNVLRSNNNAVPFVSTPSQLSTDFDISFACVASSIYAFAVFADAVSVVAAVCEDCTAWICWMNDGTDFADT